MRAKTSVGLKFRTVGFSLAMEVKLISESRLATTTAVRTAVVFLVTHSPSLLKLKEEQ